MRDKESNQPPSPDPAWPRLLPPASIVSDGLNEAEDILILRQANQDEEKTIRPLCVNMPKLR